MTITLTTDQARDLVWAAVRRVVPDADPAQVGPDDDLRAALELDSLDLLEYVETLSMRSGRRIDDADYSRVTTVAGAVALLTAERALPPRE